MGKRYNKFWHPLAGFEPTTSCFEDKHSSIWVTETHGLDSFDNGDRRGNRTLVVGFAIRCTNHSAIRSGRGWRNRTFVDGIKIRCLTTRRIPNCSWSFCNPHSPISSEEDCKFVSPNSLRLVNQSFRLIVQNKGSIRIFDGVISQFSCAMTDFGSALVSPERLELSKSWPQTRWYSR